MIINTPESLTSPIPDEYIIELNELDQTWPLANIVQKYLKQDGSFKNIIVLGAYKGKLIHYLVSRPDLRIASIEGYDPQQWAIDIATERLAAYPNVTIYPYGLGNTTGSFTMNEFGTDAASFVRQAVRSDHEGQGIIHNANVLFDKDWTDLLIVNIEGYEYPLLRYLLNQDPNIFLKVNSIAIQFHDDFASPREHADILWELDHLFPYNFSYFLNSWGFWYK